MHNEYLEKTEYVDYDDPGVKRLAERLRADSPDELSLIGNAYNVEYKVATPDDMEQLMSSRLEMLKVVNDLDFAYEFSEETIENSKDYFKNGDHSTILAMDGERIVGCATICYFRIMPTFSHPSGKRAYLMNVYTMKEWQRHGIAKKMVSMLIEEAWKRGVTEISLDATEEGRPLYKNLGFVESTEGMVLVK